MEVVRRSLKGAHLGPHELDPHFEDDIFGYISLYEKFCIFI